MFSEGQSAKGSTSTAKHKHVSFLIIKDMEMQEILTFSEVFMHFFPNKWL